MVSHPSITLGQALGSFGRADYLAFQINWTKERLFKDMIQIKRPMRTTRDENKLRPGDTLNLYELLKRDEKSAAAVWQKLGLKKEFQKMFPQEELFWKSDLSFVEIYDNLSKEKKNH